MQRAIPEQILIFVLVRLHAPLYTVPNNYFVLVRLHATRYARANTYFCANSSPCTALYRSKYLFLC